MRQGSGQGRRVRCKNSSCRATRYRELTAWQQLHEKGRASGQQLPTEIQQKQDTEQQDNNDNESNDWIDIDSNDSQWGATSQQKVSGEDSVDDSGVANTNKHKPMEHVVVGREEVERKLAKLKTGVGLALQGGAGPFFR